MPRLHEEWGLRDALGRSCHVSVSLRAKARELDGCHHHAGEDEGGAKEGDGAQDLADQEEREDSGADRLEREGEAGGLGGHVGLHERLGDKAVGRADECERNDNDDLARRAGKREAAKGKCGDTREQAAEAQLPNAQSQRVDIFDKALRHNDMAGIDKGREQHDDRAGIQAGKVGAREQQHAAGDDGGADEHLALGGATQQGRVGKRRGIVKIVEEKREEVFGEEYDAFAQGLTRDINEKLWKSISLVDDGNVSTQQFFDIYHDYFG